MNPSKEKKNPSIPHLFYRLSFFFSSKFKKMFKMWWRKIVSIFDIEYWKILLDTFLTTFPPRELLPKDPCHLHSPKARLFRWPKGSRLRCTYEDKYDWVQFQWCHVVHTKYIVKNGTKLRNKILIFWLRKLTKLMWCCQNLFTALLVLPVLLWCCPWVLWHWRMCARIFRDLIIAVHSNQ